MKKLLGLAAVVVALAAAAPADAVVNRTIGTTCYGSPYLVSQRFNPDVQWLTGIPCSNYVPDPYGKPWYTVDRPQTDLYAATQAAHHFWPGCGLEWYGVNDMRSAPGHWYFTFYHVSC